MVLSRPVVLPQADVLPGDNGEDYFVMSFRAMGSPCRVDYSAASPAQAQEFEAKVIGWVQAFEQEFSRFLPDSCISRIRQSAGGDWVEVSAEALSLFALCDWFHWITQGLFDPTSLPLLSLWDYHAEHPVLPTKEQMDLARSRMGWKKFQRDGRRVRLPEPGMGLDLGGIGKEYAVDRVMEMAEAFGIRNCLVNFGLDLRVRGEPP